MRLQVYLSRNGVCSRRAALRIVQEGRVAVNGRIVREPSTDIQPGKDRIAFTGKEIISQSYTYILLNKPRGFITTKKDRFAEKTVLDLLPAGYQHLSPAGRLDKDTEGLLVLTNDGDTAFKLTHPKFNVKKVYEVRIRGRLEEKEKVSLEKGVWLDGEKTAPAEIKHIRPRKNETEFAMTIHEGRKRQIRRMLAGVGRHVVSLKRLSQGPLVLGDLKIGRWRELSREEIERVKKI